jgi:hypothetical protein
VEASRGRDRRFRESKRALQVASEQVSEHGAELMVVSVWTPPPPTAPPFGSFPWGPTPPS